MFSQQVPRPQQRLRAELRLLLRQGERELSVRDVPALQLLPAQGERGRTQSRGKVQTNAESGPTFHRAAQLTPVVFVFYP